MIDWLSVLKMVELDGTFLNLYVYIIEITFVLNITI